MKLIVTLVLIFSQLLVFSQNKEDFLACFQIIMEQEDFQPAFENKGITGERLIITSTQKQSRSSNECENLRQSLTGYDFYGFRERIRVIQGDDKTVKELGYNPLHILNFSFYGGNDLLFFQLSTVVENQKLRYSWHYKFIKEDGKWELAARKVNKRK